MAKEQKEQKAQEQVVYNANLTATVVPTNKFDGKNIVSTNLYYLVVETTKGNTMINVGEKTYKTITELTKQ